MAQLNGFTVTTDKGDQVASEFAGKPGEKEIREGLAAMERGHHRVAIDLIMDGLELYSNETGVTLPYD